jgi:adenylate cyclase
VRRPDPLDPQLAAEVLDLTIREWPHGADGHFALFEVLRRAGVPLDRAEVFFPVRHPTFDRARSSWDAARGGRWFVEKGSVRVEETSETRQRARSPRLEAAGHAGKALADQIDPSDLTAAIASARQAQALVPVALRGAVDARLCAVELNSSQHAVTLFATDQPGGFDAAALRALATAGWGSGALMRVARWRSLAHIIATTYVGPTTGRRVLAGELRLGEVERRTAVVWFSDLRGFTAMSMERPPEDVVRAINTMFAAVADAVHGEGGEVLKLIGDAVLAIFPCDTPDAVRPAIGAARRAVGAARAALPEGVAIGVGLHWGELAYGNVGSADRLDFTVIGRTVNLASRMESLAASLSLPVLATAEVAAAEPEAWQRVGAFPVKGVAGAVEVFAPVAG